MAETETQADASAALAFMPTIKAHIIGSGHSISRAVTIDEQDVVNIGALPPPYPPEYLCYLIEHNVALRPNIDAMVQNIDGFGVRLEPVIDLKAENAAEQIEDAILLERMAAGDSDPVVTSAEVEERKKHIERAARLEKLRLDNWLQTCAAPLSLVELKDRTRHDLEGTGNAYWEVRRNGLSQPHRFAHIPSATMRLMPVDRDHVQAPVQRRVSAISFEKEFEPRRFRRFVQLVQGQERVFFKEFGDTRTLSSRSGSYYESDEHLASAEPGVLPATEIYHWSIYSSRSAYGIPRWIGAWLAVLGSRASEEVNYIYFDKKGIPPLAITVSGGRLAEGTVELIKQHVEEQLQGRANFHKILVLEAESGPGTTTNASQVRIRLEKLTDAQQTDALFQNYKANCTQDIRAQFRLSPILTGDQRDANRATADAVLAQAEQQVFQPAREAEDHVFNEIILAEKGIRYWRVVSNSPVTKDPPTLAKMIKELVAVGVLTPAEGRKIARDVFNLDLPELEDEWTKRPLALTLAQLQGGAAPGAPTGQPTTQADQDGGRDVAQRLLDLRDQLRGIGGQSWEQAQATKSAARELEEEVIQVPRAVWDRWFQQGDAPPASA